jgi:hypothetical protein
LEDTTVIERRKFLAIVGTPVAAAFTGLVPIWGAGRPPAPALGAQPARTGFERLLRSRFTMTGGSGEAAAVRLVEVKDGPRASGLEQWSAIFRAESGAPLPAGLYEARHPEAGTFSLYMDSAGDRMYRADFSHLVA